MASTSFCFVVVPLTTSGASVDVTYCWIDWRNWNQVKKSTQELAFCAHWSTHTMPVKDRHVWYFIYRRQRKADVSKTCSKINMCIILQQSDFLCMLINTHVRIASVNEDIYQHFQKWGKQRRPQLCFLIGGHMPFVPTPHVRACASFRQSIQNTKESSNAMLFLGFYRYSTSFD